MLDTRCMRFSSQWCIDHPTFVSCLFGFFEQLRKRPLMLTGIYGWTNSSKKYVRLSHAYKHSVHLFLMTIMTIDGQTVWRSELSRASVFSMSHVTRTPPPPPSPPPPSPLLLLLLLLPFIGPCTLSSTPAQWLLPVPRPGEGEKSAICPL